MLNHLRRLPFHPLDHSLLFSSIRQEMRVIFSFAPIHSRLLSFFILTPSQIRSVASFLPCILHPLLSQCLISCHLLLLIVSFVQPVSSFFSRQYCVTLNFPLKGCEINIGHLPNGSHSDQSSLLTLSRHQQPC